MVTSVHPERPTIEVTDVSARRGDLVARREVKYTFHDVHLGALRSLLLGNGKRQVYHREVSVVRSVYFDTPGLAGCWDNIEGIGRRVKLRLRWYDSVLPGQDCFLEVKWRVNRVTGKRRLRLHSDQALGIYPYKTLLSSLATVVPEDYQLAMLEHPDPVLLVEYRREHFTSPEGRLRATLDYGLVYYDQTGRSRISTAFGQRYEGFAVLEGKLPVGCEEQLGEFLHPFTARVQRCSKYVHGCHLLHLVRW
jgi:hypothetical protein